MNKLFGSSKLQAVVAGIVGMVGVALMSPTAHAENREVRIINQTNTVLVGFYASNAGTNDWEENMLGWGAVGSGGSFIANIDDGTGYCRFDLKGIFADGSTAVKYGVDVCRIEVFRFTDS